MAIDHRLRFPTYAAATAPGEFEGPIQELDEVQQVQANSPRGESVYGPLGAPIEAPADRADTAGTLTIPISKSPVHVAL